MLVERWMVFFQDMVQYVDESVQRADRRLKILLSCAEFLVNLLDKAAEEPAVLEFVDIVR